MKQIGALAYCNTTALYGQKVIRLAILISALEVHGYQYSDYSIRVLPSELDFDSLSLKSKRIMNRFAKKISLFHQLYLKKRDKVEQGIIRSKNIDTISIVLLALFDDMIENQQDGDNFIGERTIPII